MLKSNDFEILFDYLEKTHSNIIMPKIVLEEIKQVYKRELKHRLDEYYKSSRSLKIMSVDIDMNIKEYSLDKETNKYIEYLRIKLNLADTDVIPYKDVFLSNLVYRAINRIKPGSSKGEEFRDAILWLCVLDIAKSSDKKIIFISNNSKDFADDNNQCLHQTLIQDANDNGVAINYYNTLKHFIKEHASNIAEITENWIRSQINLENVNNQFIDILNEHGEGMLLDW